MTPEDERMLREAILIAHSEGWPQTLQSETEAEPPSHLPDDLKGLWKRMGTP